MHPPGYHKDKFAQERCYSCSDPSMLEPTAADIEEAKKLIAEGWMSTSTKYHRLARVHVPKLEHAITFSPDVPSWLREDIAYRYDYWVRHHARMDHPEVEHKEVSLRVFRAFKKLGGEMA